MTKYIYLKIKSRSLLIVEHNLLSYIGINGLKVVWNLNIDFLTDNMLFRQFFKQSMQYTCIYNAVLYHQYLPILRRLVSMNNLHIHTPLPT